MPFKDNLKKLGISGNVRIIDSAQYLERMNTLNSNINILLNDSDLNINTLNLDNDVQYEENLEDEYTNENIQNNNIKNKRIISSDKDLHNIN